MLGRKVQITKAAFLRKLCPYVRLKTNRIKGTIQAEVLALKLLRIRLPVDVITRPIAIVVTQCP